MINQSPNADLKDTNFLVGHEQDGQNP